MICICGQEIIEPPFESWEECPNCDRKLTHIEPEKKRRNYIAKLEAVVRIVKRILKTEESEFLPKSLFVRRILDDSIELYKALEALDNESEE